MSAPRQVHLRDVYEMITDVGRHAPPVVRRWFPELAEAFTRAANDDPLFPDHEAGAEVTAAILVALAWLRSGFQRAVWGTQGVGLFQFRLVNGEDDRGILGTSTGSAYVAIDQIRQSLSADHELPWFERLSTLCDRHGSCHGKSQGVHVLSTAARLVKEHIDPEIGRRGVRLLEQGEAA